MTATLEAPTRLGGGLSPAPTGVAVGYERISRFRVQKADVDTMVTRGVERQRTDNSRAAEVLQLGPVTPFRDEDRSASQFATKEREQWLELLAFVRAGKASHVLVWLLERAARTTEAVSELLEACRIGGALIVQSGTMDVANPHNPEDIFRLKLAGLLAEYEVAKMSLRQRRHKEALAEKGAPHGGRRRFGYEKGMAAVRESEAVVVRELVTSLLAGASLRSLAAGLNEAGVLGTEAWKGWHPPLAHPVPKWTGPNVRNLLLRPHLAGLRVHHGKVAGKASWPGIITVAEHEQVKHVLGAAGRKTEQPKTGNARKYLLAGLATCATCGAHLRGRPGPTTDGGRAYQCMSGKHAYRAVELVDRVVTEQVVDRLRQLDETGQLQLDSAEDELAQLERAREALEARMAEYVAAVATMPPAAFAAATTQLQSELDALEARKVELAATEARPARVLAGMTGEAAAAGWAAADLSRQREVIQLLAERVELAGASRTGSRIFHASDVLISWR